MKSSVDSAAPISLNRNTIDLGVFKPPLVYANLFFAFMTVLGQVGQNISLPLWLDSVTNCTSTNIANLLLERDSCLDNYFVYSFSTIWFVIVFGFALLVTKIFKPHLIGKTEKEFPHTLLFVIGGCGSFTGLLLSYASSSTRTAPYLQSILINILIPVTVAVRFIMLRKVPTRRKFICAVAVVLSLFICLLPTIFPDLDPNGKKDLGGASGLAGLLWPLCFMLGFAPAAVVNVLQEKGIKMRSVASTRGVNLMYFFFWTSLYQMLLALAFFWTDIIPGFGKTRNIHEFAQKWWFGVRCFMGHAGCSARNGVRGAVFISMYVLTLVGGGNLLRYAEGATFLAIVTALVTPLGFLFWTLFEEKPFVWHPEGHVSTWFSLGGLVLMVPSIFLYNTGPPENTSGRQREEVLASGCTCHPDEVHATETDRLINVKEKNYKATTISHNDA